MSNSGANTVTEKVTPIRNRTSPVWRGLMEVMAIVLILGTIAAAAASLPTDSPAYQEWFRQVTFLFLGAALISLSIVLVKQTIVKRVLFVFLLLVVAIIAVPLRGVDSFRFLLLFLIAAAGFSCRDPITIAAGPIAYVAAILLFRDATLAWQQWPGELSNTDVVVLAVSGILVASSLLCLELKLRAIVAMQSELPRLRQSIEELSAANLGYSSFTQLARQQSALEERNRITREIHDGVGYTLTNIIMLSEVSLDVCPDSNTELHENIDAIRMQAKTGLFDTRRALRKLRSTDAAMPRGVEAIRNLVNTYSQSTKIEAALELLVKADVLEDSSLFLVVYRFVQVALTNTFHHGRATHAVIRFQQDAQWLIVSVVDNGKGAGVVSEGIGLQGVRERLEDLGGELDYNSIEGFTVIARIPLLEDL